MKLVNRILRVGVVTALFTLCSFALGQTSSAPQPRSLTSSDLSTSKKHVIKKPGLAVAMGGPVQGTKIWIDGKSIPPDRYPFFIWDENYRAIVRCNHTRWSKDGDELYDVRGCSLQNGATFDDLISGVHIMNRDSWQTSRWREKMWEDKYDRLAGVIKAAGPGDLLVVGTEDTKGVVSPSERFSDLVVTDTGTSKQLASCDISPTDDHTFTACHLSDGATWEQVLATIVSGTMKNDKYLSAQLDTSELNARLMYDASVREEAALTKEVAAQKLVIAGLEDEIEVLKGKSKP